MPPALSELPPPTISFASDNAAAVHPAVMDALVAANDGSALAYGADAWTDRVERRFAELFGTDVTVALCWGGTGANVVALQSLLRPWQAVICTDSAHIAVDECGAPERFTGAKLIDVAAPHAKLLPERLVSYFEDLAQKGCYSIQIVSGNSIFFEDPVVEIDYVAVFKHLLAELVKEHAELGALVGQALSPEMASYTQKILNS